MQHFPMAAPNCCAEQRNRASSGFFRTESGCSECSDPCIHALLYPVVVGVISASVAVMIVILLCDSLSS